MRVGVDPSQCSSANTFAEAGELGGGTMVGEESCTAALEVAMSDATVLSARRRVRRQDGQNNRAQWEHFHTRHPCRLCAPQSKQ